MSLTDALHLFTAIDHVGIAVPDLDEAIAFYRDTFGMETVHEETNEEQGVREAMVAVGESGFVHPAARPALPRLDDRASSWTAPAPASSRSPTASTTSTRSRDVLRERGLRLLYDEPRRGTSGSRVNFVHPKDAGGVLGRARRTRRFRASGELATVCSRRIHMVVATLREGVLRVGFVHESDEGSVL